MHYSLTERCWSKENFEEVDRCVIEGNSMLVVLKVVIPDHRQIYLTAVDTVASTAFDAPIRLSICQLAIVSGGWRTRGCQWYSCYAGCVWSVVLKWRLIVRHRNRTSSLKYLNWCNYLVSNISWLNQAEITPLPEGKAGNPGLRSNDHLRTKNTDGTGSKITC